jgi:hypothetical protein
MSIETIRVRMEAATAGPWEWVKESSISWDEPITKRLTGLDGETVLASEADGYEVDDDWVDISDADETFIAHARTDIEKLLAVAEAGAAVLAEFDRTFTALAPLLGEHASRMQPPTMVAIRDALNALDAEDV